jgi:hypothetical protein
MNWTIEMAQSVEQHANISPYSAGAQLILFMLASCWLYSYWWEKIQAIFIFKEKTDFCHFPLISRQIIAFLKWKIIEINAQLISKFACHVSRMQVHYQILDEPSWPAIRGHLLDRKFHTNYSKNEPCPVNSAMGKLCPFAFISKILTRWSLEQVASRVP